MVDDEARIGMAVDQCRARIDVAPEKNVHRKIVLNGRAQDPVEAWIVWRSIRLLGHDDADADRTRCFLPLRDNVRDRRIVGVDRLNQREPVWVSLLHAYRIAAIVLVH